MGTNELYQLMQQYGKRGQSEQIEKLRRQPTPDGQSDLPTSEMGVESSFHCPACKDFGFVREDLPISHPRFGKLLPCDLCGGARRQQWLAQFSRLDGELAAVTKADWIERPGLEKVTEYLRGAVADRTWATLSGPPGTGKSMWLAILTNGAIEKGRTAVYTTMADLLADLRETFNPGSHLVYSRLYADVTEADLLCLDEIEKVHLTGWAEEQIFRLIEHRFRARGRIMTVLATQRDLRHAETSVFKDTRYPGYLESRIRDSANWLICDFWAVPDFRSFRQKQMDEIL